MKMHTIYRIFDGRRRTPSDINQHLEFLSRLASLCDHITEFGVRRGNSTIALLYGRPKTLICYDIKPFLNKGVYLELAKEYGVVFECFQANTLTMMPISATDLLFIDTVHTYAQLRTELSIHHKRVNKYLVFHDTSTFGDRGQAGGRGIWPAIAEFLKANPEWTLWQYYDRNNGLTVLRRERTSPPG